MLIFEITEDDLNKIPPTGPIMVVANHPFGGVDGLILGAVLTQARPDVRLLANELLGYIEPIQPFLFEVDVFGGEGSIRKNLRSMKEAVKWMEAGGCVATFPSGTVSHFSFETMMVVDPRWNDHIVRISRKSNASVLPLHFEGRNSILFQLFGLIHPLLRTILLPREFVRMRGKTVQVSIGKPVTPGRMNDFKSEKEATQYIRLQSYILKEREHREQQDAKVRRFPNVLTRKPQVLEPIVEPVDSQTLAAEVSDLPGGCVTFESRSF